jgi:hypothetical protein
VEPIVAAAPDAPASTATAEPPAAAPAAEARAAAATESADRPATAAVVSRPESAPPPEAASEPPTSEPADARGLAPVEMGASSNGHGDDEPDAGEVRRQIAAASRSFDPDHQIRRAMDAFLGPMSDPRDRH